jgi:hypothetical protein
MRTSTPTRVVALVARVATLAACAAAVLTGCTAGPGSGRTSTPASGADEPGPLDEYVAQVYGYDEADAQAEAQAQMDDEQHRAEEIVAACMQEQGFDYVPWETTDTLGTMPELGVEWGTREFAERYGYAISIDPWAGSDVSDKLEQEAADPNADYVAAMTESQQLAYYAALYGEDSAEATPDEADVAERSDDAEGTEWDWTTAGCQGKAHHEVYEGDQEPDRFGDLQEDISAMWVQVSTDPRVADADADWASCMADAGYAGLTRQADASTDLSAEWSEIQGWDDPTYLAQTEDWDWDADPAGPPAPTPDPDAVAAFTDRELAQAVADIDCKDTVDYDARWSAVNLEIQQDFVDAHRAELDAWVEAATAAREASS